MILYKLTCGFIYTEAKLLKLYKREPVRLCDCLRHDSSNFKAYNHVELSKLELAIYSDTLEDEQESK